MNVSEFAPRTGRVMLENGTWVNVADLLSGDGLTVTEKGKATSPEINAVATTGDQSIAFSVDKIAHIVNDGGTDLYIAFDASSSVAANRITVKAGEIMNDLPRRCQANVHFSCLAGTCPFRIVGVK